MNDLGIGILIGLGIYIVADLLDYLANRRPTRWERVLVVPDGVFYVADEQQGKPMHRCPKCGTVCDIETPYCPGCGRKMKPDEE